MTVDLKRIQIRRGTTAEWTEAAPIPAVGELALDTTTGLLRVGDGATAFLSLPIISNSETIGSIVSVAGEVSLANYGGTAQAITADTNDSAGNVSIGAGFKITFRVQSTNTAADPTLALNGGDPYPIKENGNGSLAAGALPAGRNITMRLTGSTPNQRWEIISNPNTLAEFDAKADRTDFNIVDNYADLETALAAGVQLDGRGQTFVLTAPITFAAGAGLRNAVLDVSGVTTDPNEACITSTGGGLSATESLTANVTEGDTTLTMADTSAYAAGDRIVLRSNDDWSVSDSVPLYEELKVASVDSGTQITMTSGALFAHTTANAARIQKITRTACGVWENLVFEGDGTQAGALEFSYVDTPQVRNITATGIDSRNIICTGTRGGYVRDCEFVGDDEDDLSYGVLYRDGTIDLVIDNIKMTRGRHTVTGGGTGGVNMRVHCSNIWGIQPRAAVYDQHAGCLNCTAYGVFDAEPNYQSGEDGLVVQGANAVVRGVKVNMMGTGRHSANIQSLVDYGSGWDVEIEGEFHNAVNTGVFFKPEGAADLGRARLDVSVRGSGDEAIEAYLQDCNCAFLDMEVDIDITGSATKQNIYCRQYTTFSFGAGRIVGRSKRANDSQENIQLQGTTNGVGTEDDNLIGNFTIAAVLENGSHGVRGVDAATGTINTAGNVYIGASTNEDGL